MENPTITIAGIDYPVKPFVGRQLRFIIPALMRFNRVARDIANMTPENYDDLYAIIYYGAIMAVDKTLTPTKLLDTPGIDFNDLMKALEVIKEVTGLFKAAPATPEGDSAAGEQQADGNP